MIGIDLAEALFMILSRAHCWTLSIALRFPVFRINTARIGGTVNWKLFWNGKKGWLFDLSSDIGEVQEISAEQPDTVETLKKHFRKWEATTAPPRWPTRHGRPMKIDGVEVETNI